jgi:hypothetical protein
MSFIASAMMLASAWVKPAGISRQTARGPA